MKEYICRICGLDLQSLPLLYPARCGDVPFREYKDGQDYANYIICPCCGSESGYYDISIIAVIQNRHKWLLAGGAWYMPEYKPDNWNLVEQMKQIPTEWS